MTRRTVVLASLLAVSLAGAQARAQSCLAPSSPSVCDPNWVPDPEISPGHEDAARVKVQSAGISVAGGRRHVVLNLTSFAHPGEVRIGVYGQGAVTVWSATAGSPGDDAGIDLKM